jgi:hypothetical protein
MEYSGAGGKLILEKNQKQKFSWHCPFKEYSKMKQQTNLECHSPRPKAVVCHLPDPPCFSLVITFNTFFH